MLDISRIEAGEFRLKKEPFDLIELINNIKESYKVIVEDKLLNFKVTIDKKIKKFLEKTGSKKSKSVLRIQV